MEQTLDLKQYFDIIKKRLWIVALVTIIATFLSAMLSIYVLKPVYETSTTLMVNKAKSQQSNIINYEDVMLNQKLVLTYGEIVKSRTVIEKVIEKLNLDMKYEELLENITVSPVKDTEIMNITVLSNDPKVGAKIANTIPKVFTQEVIRITKADSVQVIDTAKTPQFPIKPRVAINVIIAAFLGLILGLFIIILIEYLDNTIKTPQDIEKHLDLPVIGVIPLFQDFK